MPDKSNLLFIAGRYWNSEHPHRVDNVCACARAVPAVIIRDWVPIVPLLYHYVNEELKESWNWSIPEVVWRRIDMQLLEHCDAMLVLSHSDGVDAEIKRAEELGIHVYEGLEALPHVSDF